MIKVKDEKKKNKLSKVLIIPDCHIPWHHFKAYRLMIRVAKDLDPDHILILGDYGDIYNLNSHGPKDPRMIKDLVNEIDEINKHLDELDDLFPRAKKKYIEGNHEWRLERYIHQRAPELFGFMKWPELLKLRNRPNWSFVEWNSHQITTVGPKNSKLYARHRPLGSSMKASAQKALCSMVFGDNHKIEESNFVSIHGEEHTCFSVGWLGDKRKDVVFGYVPSMHQWQLGFGIVYIDEKTGYFYREKIQILDDISCVFNGQLYK